MNRRDWIILGIICVLALAYFVARRVSGPAPQAFPTTVPTTVATTTTVPTTYPTTTVTTLPGANPKLYGCNVFPPNDHVWNSDISGVAADPDSAAMIASYTAVAGSGATLAISLGTRAWFINEATGTTPTYKLLNVSNSPPTNINPPIDAFPFIASYQWQSKGQTASGDHHLMVLNTGTCHYFETYVSGTEPPPTWQVVGTTLTQHAYYGKEFDLTKPYPSPAPPNAVNLAGTPQFAGMVRWEDWLSRNGHALQIDILSHALGGSVYPANSHLPKTWYHGPTSYTLPLPDGARLRLKASYTLTCSPACPQAQFFVELLKTYGAYVMDQHNGPTASGYLYATNYWNGSTWALPWTSQDLAQLGKIPFSALEVVPPPGCTRVSLCVTE